MRSISFEASRSLRRDAAPPPPCSAGSWGHRREVAHPMHPAALPAGAKDPPERRFQPLMGIGDHQLDPAQTAPCQALQKARPEGLSLRGSNVQADDLAPAVAVRRHSDYRSDRDDAAALALLQVSGVEPQIRPLAGERPIEEGMHALVDLPAFAGAGSCRAWKPATC